MVFRLSGPTSERVFRFMKYDAGSPLWHTKRYIETHFLPGSPDGSWDRIDPEPFVYAALPNEHGVVMDTPTVEVSVPHRWALTMEETVVPMAVFLPWEFDE